MKRFTTALVFLLALTPHAYGHSADTDVHFFNWAVVDGGNESMSSMQEMDEVTRLEQRVGNTFLYIHQDSDRYVIRDQALMDRAQKALQPLRDAKGVIGDWKLDKKAMKLDAKVGRAKARRDTDESLDRAIKNVKREMRAILEEAKSRHLAQRVE